MVMFLSCGGELVTGDKTTGALATTPAVILGRARKPRRGGENYGW